MSSVEEPLIHVRYLKDVPSLTMSAGVSGLRPKRPEFTAMFSAEEQFSFPYSALFLTGLRGISQPCDVRPDVHCNS
jgi:hypothetical protein